MLEIGKKGKSGKTYHLTNPKYIRIKDFYQQALKILGINFLDIKFVNGPSPEVPSQSIVLQNCENCVGRTILKTLFQEEIINKYKYLEVAFPLDRDNTLEVSPDKIEIYSGITTTLKIEYIIQKDLGILELQNYRYNTTDFGYCMIYKLVDHQF